MEEPEKIIGATMQVLPMRGLTKETMEYYRVLTKVDGDGTPVEVGFPYGNAFKIRSLRIVKDKDGNDIVEKKFWSKGDINASPLFGMERFSRGSSKSITITEGEYDAMSLFQILGSKYPVVSIRGASSAKADCSTARDYLNSFERIYLCLDNDEPGRKAKAAIASIFSDKVYDVKLTKHKDANEYLQQGDGDELKRTWWNADRILRDGIVSSYRQFRELLDGEVSRPAIEYPFPTLQEMSYGIRLGECHLIKAPEGIGKTEVIRAIESHVLRNTDYNVGIIHLEEPKERVIKGLAGHELRKPVHLPDAGLDTDAIMAGFERISGRDNRVHVYTHFGSDDPDVILDTIRFLATSCDCRVVFLDHISMVVSGLGESDERTKLDYISTRLVMMAEELEFALVFISHVNDDGLTRGSRNISKVAHFIVSLARDKTASSESERNTTYLTVEKNRFGGLTGPAGRLVFDRGSFTISEQLDGGDHSNSNHGSFPPV